MAQDEKNQDEFPYPLIYVHGKDAEAELRRLMRTGKEEGFSSIIIGHSEVSRVRETMKGPCALARNRELPQLYESSVEDILRAAESIHPEHWFREREEESDMEAEDEDEFGEPSYREGLSVPFEVVSRKPHEEVLIARIPTPYSWEIPAYLKAGGWNDCPEAAVQVAVSKYWHGLYAAELACMSGDVAEYLVAKPPTDRASADALAREQYLYCGDIVWQGVGTVPNLSKTLLGSRYWYFWWD